MNEKQSNLDKARQQNAEITRELVEATNENGHNKSESRILREKLKNAQRDVQRLEEEIGIKEKEINEIKSDQFSIIHKNKSDFLKV